MKTKRGGSRVPPVLLGVKELEELTKRMKTALDALNTSEANEADGEVMPRFIVSTDPIGSLPENTRLNLGLREDSARHLKLAMPTSYGQEFVLDIVVQISRPYYFEGLMLDLPDMAKRTIMLGQLIPKGKKIGDLLKVDIESTEGGHAASLLNIHSRLVYVVLSQLTEAIAARLVETVGGLVKARFTGIGGELVLERVIEWHKVDKYSRVVSAGFTDEFFDKRGADSRPRVWKDEGGSKPVRLQVKVKQFKSGKGLERFNQSIKDHRRKHPYTMLVSYIPLPCSFSREKLEMEEIALLRERILEGGDHLVFEAVHLALAAKQNDKTLVLDDYPVLQWLDDVTYGDDKILWSWHIEGGVSPVGRFAKVLFEGENHLRGSFALLAEKPHERVEEFKRVVPRMHVVLLKSAYTEEDRQALREFISKRLTPLPRPQPIPTLDRPLSERKQLFKDRALRFAQQRGGRVAMKIFDVNFYVDEKSGKKNRILHRAELDELKDDPHMQVRMVIKMLLE